MLVVGRQHALIKKCAINNEVRLITRVYGKMYMMYLRMAKTYWLAPLASLMNIMLCYHECFCIVSTGTCIIWCAKFHGKSERRQYLRFDSTRSAESFKWYIRMRSVLHASRILLAVYSLSGCWYMYVSFWLRIHCGLSVPVCACRSKHMGDVAISV